MKVILILLSYLSVLAASGAEFEAPYRLKGGDTFVRVEPPGWAAPSLADLDGDGEMELLVGQFNQGKVRAYRGLGDGRFAEGEWLTAEGATAKVPGVW